jgi:peptide/nickel transport system substrate-binding protein
VSVTQQLDRRAFLQRTGLVATGLGFLGQSGFLAACGRTNTAGAGAPTTDTLRFAFLADMQVPDPDIFYEGEGLVVTLSCYDNLLKYKPDSPDIEPMLAKAWEVSPDGLTYTFHLRDDVKFHDGTPFDAAAMIASFDRRTKVDQGPAYMLTNVESATAPDPHTLVVKLKTTLEPFLDYLACPWGPKPVSPALIAAHAEGDDLAQKWLTTNDAGTGPFKIVEFVPASHYTLEAVPDYWGTKSSFKQLRIEIIPDVTTQRLKLDNGELDIVTKGLPVADIESFAANPKFTVTSLPMATKVSLYFNPNKAPFDNKELRKAVTVALDRPALVTPTYKNYGTVSTQFYPPGFLPDGAATDDPKKDTAKLASMVAGLADKKVDLAYDEQGGATDRRMTELIQAQLQALGLEVTVRGIPTSQAFSMYNTPVDQQPNLLLDVAGGDALNPDTQTRIFFRTGAAPLNWFNYADPGVDAAMDAAAARADAASADKGYADVAKLIIDEAWMANIADIKDVIIMRAGITNIVHELAAARFIRLNELRK